MFELVRHQHKEGDAYYKNIFAKFNNQFRECRVDLAVTATNVMQARYRWLQLSEDELALSRVFPAQPEHYAVPR